MTNFKFQISNFKFQKLAVVILLLLSFLFTNLAWAQESVGQPTINPSLLDVVLQARDKLLDEVSAEFASGKKFTVVKSKNVTLEVTLALWRENTNEVKYVKAKKTSKTITALDNSGYIFKLKRDNGVNSDIEVASDLTTHVVAIKHPVFISIGTTKKPQYRLEPAVYVPYSSFLNTPEIAAAGEKYISDNITAVYDELKNTRARSLAYPKILLAEAIDPALVKSIIAIEHVSASALISGDALDYLSTFHVILATNRNLSYSYSRSTASAFGIVQFIPSTYKSVRKIRADLLLNPSFDQGMADPYNAIKAQVALLDYNLASMPKVLRQKYENNPKLLGAYLSAVYNGGPTRVNRAMNYWGEDWAEDQTTRLANLKKQELAAKSEVKNLTKALAKKGLTMVERKKLEAQKKEANALAKQLAAKYASGNQAKLKNETRLYVAKYRLVYDHFAKSYGNIAFFNL